MKLRAYDHERDFDALQQWDTGLRMHMMWCAGRFPYPPEREHFAEALWAVCGQTGDQPYVAENENGNAVGFCCISYHAGMREGMLKFVIVDHRLRGQGIGGEMLRLAVRQIFDTTDAEAVHLNVFAENAAARRCYEKAGFTERDVTPAAFRFGDEQWSRCNMILRRRI